MSVASRVPPFPEIRHATSHGNSCSRLTPVQQKSANSPKLQTVRAWKRAGFCLEKDAVPKKSRRYIGTCRDIGASRLRGKSNTHFVQMTKQGGRILVDAVGPGALQFFLPVASRQQTDAERPCPAGGQHIPDAVTDDHAPIDW